MESNMTPVTEEMNVVSAQADLEAPVSLSNGHPAPTELA